MLVPYQEIQALGFPNSPRKLGLYEKPWACISWYGPCTQLVNSKYEELGKDERYLVDWDDKVDDDMAFDHIKCSISDIIT